MPERIAPVATQSLEHARATTPSIDFADIASGMPTGDSPDSSAPKPVPPPSDGDGAKPAEGGAVVAPAAEEPVGVGTPFEKGFKQLTARSKELRSREDAVKPLEALGRSVSPVQAQALAKALQSGNPMAAMNALGFAYADIAASVAEGGRNPVKPTEQAAEVKPVAGEDPEITEIKAERRLAAGEIPLTRKQWQRLQGGLTSAPASGPTSTEATRDRPGNAPVSRTRTLTNNAGAPPSAPAANPTDPIKLISDLARDPNMPWS